MKQPATHDRRQFRDFGRFVGYSSLCRLLALPRRPYFRVTGQPDLTAKTELTVSETGQPFSFMDKCLERSVLHLLRYRPAFLLT